MKKRVFLAIILLVILILTGFLVNAQINPNDLEKKIDDVSKVGDKLTNDQQRSAYLSQEWNKMLQGTQIGKILDSIAGFFKVLNPVFSVIIGEEFSWGWLFFLTLIIYILLLDYSFDFITLFEPFEDTSLFFAKFYKWTFFIIVFVVISTIRIPRKIASLVISLVSGTGEWWVQLIAIILLFIIIISLIVFSGKLKKFSKLSKERRKQKVLEEKVEKQQKRDDKRSKVEKKREAKQAERDEDDEMLRQAEDDFNPS